MRAWQSVSFCRIGSFLPYWAPAASGERWLWHKTAALRLLRLIECYCDAGVFTLHKFACSEDTDASISNKLVSQGKHAGRRCSVSVRRAAAAADGLDASAIGHCQKHRLPNELRGAKSKANEMWWLEQISIHHGENLPRGDPQAPLLQ